MQWWFYSTTLKECDGYLGLWPVSAFKHKDVCVNVELCKAVWAQMATFSSIVFWELSLEWIVPKFSPRFCLRRNLLLDCRIQLCTELAFMYFMYCECSGVQNPGLKEGTELLPTNHISMERRYKICKLQEMCFIYK